jgi:hypothetical protein
LLTADVRAATERRLLDHGTLTVNVRTCAEIGWLLTFTSPPDDAYVPLGVPEGTVMLNEKKLVAPGATVLVLCA